MALTADIARDLMQRSMTTGVPTSEFDKYGGYDAVRSVYNQSGGTYSLNDLSPEFKQAAAQQIAQSGVGNLSLLADTGVSLTPTGVANMAKNGIDVSTIEQAMRNYGVAGIGVSQSQYDSLRKAYDELVAKQNKPTTTGGGGSTVGGSTVDDGSSLNGGVSGLPWAGKVYAPDGREFNSVAEAVAAGVTNWSYSKPAGKNPGLINNADTLSGITAVPDSAVGNTNWGGLISGVNQQLTNQGPAKVWLPPGTYNPFKV